MKRVPPRAAAAGFAACGGALCGMVGAVALLFAYGSLTARVAGANAVEGVDDAAVARPWTLRGWRRGWGVAADNGVDLPGYRFWVEPDTGKRPAVHVVFLDLVADPAASVNGALVEVATDAWSALDDRERNYTCAVVGQCEEEDVWAYRGTAEGRSRLRIGLVARTAVIARSYRASVLAGFDALGPGERERFERLTDPEPCPVITLEPVLLG